MGQKRKRQQQIGEELQAVQVEAASTEAVQAMADTDLFVLDTAGTCACPPRTSRRVLSPVRECPFGAKCFRLCLSPRAHVEKVAAWPAGGARRVCVHAQADRCVPEEAPGGLRARACRARLRR